MSKPGSPITSTSSGAIRNTTASEGHVAASNAAGSAMARHATRGSGTGTGSLRVVERDGHVSGGPPVDDDGRDRPVEEVHPGEHHGRPQDWRPPRRRDIADDLAVEEDGRA